MSQHPSIATRPGRILVATDLSARCDRAFDRAVWLAREWRAELLVLTVLEGRQAPDEIYAWIAREGEGARERYIRREVTRQVIDLDFPVHVEIREVDVADAIREVVSSAECDLVVTGMARNETFGRILLGSTVERLARALAQPLLVVRNRAHSTYSRVIVATDFSEASAHALRTAAGLFPTSSLVLYHAFTGGEPAGDFGARAGAIESGECAEFIAGSGLSAAERERLNVVIEHGSVEVALTRYVREHPLDLVVLGTHGRSRPMNALLGRSAARLLEWLPADTLLVRKPR